jgi:hypothetical protein
MRVVVIGTGALASAVCHALADMLSVAAEVVVVSGDASRGSSLTYAAGVRATLGGAPVRYRSLTCDVISACALRRLHEDVRPDVVLNCASLHSPREEAQTPSEWTALVHRLGFGLTLPLQAVPAIPIGRMLADVASDAIFMNACYPDLVNPLLRALDLPIFCGVGNANLVAAALQDALHLPDQRGLRLLAHHRHLYDQDDPQQDVRGWLDDRRIAGVGTLLAPLRSVDRTHRNPISGRAAAQVIEHVLSDRELLTTVPGPLGLPGGYSVRISGRRLVLDLPPMVTAVSAVAWNRQQCLLDGADVQENGDVRFALPIATELEQIMPELAAGFHASRTLEVSEQIVQLRRRWRML